MTIKIVNTILFLVFLFLILNLNAQNLKYSYNYPYKFNKEYVKSYFATAGHIFKFPVRWDKKQWLIAGGVVAGGVLLYTFDEQINNFFLQNQSNGLDFTSKYIFEPWGSGLYPAILVGGFYVQGLASGNIKSRQIALGATQSFIVAGIGSQILKHLFHRHRPYQDMPPNHSLWEGPFGGLQYTSFPSGHTITAFSLAAFFSSVYKDKLWVQFVSYGLASGAALQRMYDNKHWSSDVFIGAALGWAIGKSVYYIFNKSPKLSMGVGPNGVSIAYKIDTKRKGAGKNPTP